MKHRGLSPADSDMEFLLIAKDLPRYGKHLFQATVSSIGMLLLCLCLLVNQWCFIPACRYVYSLTSLTHEQPHICVQSAYQLSLLIGVTTTAVTLHA